MDRHGFLDLSVVPESLSSNTYHAQAGQLQLLLGTYSNSPSYSASYICPSYVLLVSPRMVSPMGSGTVGTVGSCFHPSFDFLELIGHQSSCSSGEPLEEFRCG